MSGDTSLRLRFGSSLVMFASAYSPLLLILFIQDIDPSTFHPRHPLIAAILIAIVGGSILFALHAVRHVSSGLIVEITKAANKSGEMFGYTIPYVLSFMKVDLGSWQVVVSLLIFLGMTFAIAYRTQTVFVNPVLAVAGYMLIDCTFKRGNTETQAMVVTKMPLKIGQTCELEQLSHYLYVAVEKQEEVS
jgi:hypothetical protein